MILSPTPRARRVLQRHFAERMQKNPAYSLRSFARHLGISPTVLSLVLGGKRALSKKALTKVLTRLEIEPSEQEQLKSEIHGRRKGPDLHVVAAEAADYRQLTLDQFAVISDWWHYAILSLLEIPGENQSITAMGKRLNIHALEVQASLERLERLGLIDQTESGTWKPSGAPIKVENALSTTATRKFHRQLLDKAQESLENDPIAARDFSSVTFAMDPKLVPYALEKIRIFRRALMQELETKSSGKEVYHLSVQIFPLSQSQESKS